MKRILVIIIFNFSTNCFAQSISWQKTYGGSQAETGSCVLQIDSGNLLICGFTESIDGDINSHIGASGTQDCWVLKIDSLGNVLRSKCFGGTTTDYSYKIIKCLDSGYLMTAYSTSQNGDVTGMHNHGPDIWLVKLDNQLSIQWERAFGSFMVEEYGSTIQTLDSGFITISQTTGDDGDVSGNHGTSFGDIWVFKVTKNGAFEWQTCLGSTLTEFPGSLLSTTDNGIIICGTVANGFGGNVSCMSPFTGENIWVVKLDSSGQIPWDKCYGSSFNDKGVEIVESPNGGYYVLGLSANSDGDVSQFFGGTDYWLLRLNDQGDLLWNKSYGGTGIDDPQSLVVASNGDIVMCGLTNSIDGMAVSNHGSNDVFIVRTDSLGNLIWSQCYGGTDSDIGYSIEMSSDGFPVFAGVTASNDYDISFNHGRTDLWVVKLSESPTRTSEIDMPFLNVTGKVIEGQLRVFFDSKVKENFIIDLTDIFGRSLMSKSASATLGRNEFYFPISSNNGFYLLRLKFETGIVTKKIF